MHGGGAHDCMSRSASTTFAGAPCRVVPSANLCGTGVIRAPKSTGQTNKRGWKAQEVPSGLPAPALQELVGVGRRLQLAGHEQRG